jgi:hypothetical protein
MTLTNILLFFILVTLATYTFMPWKGIDKGSLSKVLLQWLMWMIVFGSTLILISQFGFIISE